MCGRFTLFADKNNLLNHFNISPDFLTVAYTKRYNITPSQQVLAIINDGIENRIGYLKWGLIPFWAKDARIGYKLMNARAETLVEKPSFKYAFKQRRCIIPSDGFYEWRRDDKKKQPYRIKLKSGDVFGFAGLWERWKDHDGNNIHSCTIITTEANDLIQDIHHRMPVILSGKDADIWLDRSVKDTHLLQDLLKPYPADEMEVYPVSPEVNSAKNDHNQLIDPLP